MVKTGRMRVSSSVWAKLVSDLDAKASEIVNLSLTARDAVEEVVKNSAEIVLGLGDSRDNYLIGEEIVMGLPRSELAEAPAVGVDSSITKPVRIAHRYYVAVSASSIIYPEGRGKSSVEDTIAFVRDAPDSADPQHSLQELSLEMFRAELSVLERAVNKLATINARGGMVVFLDGPIVDPPSFPKVDGLSEKYREYVRSRALAVKKVLDMRGLVVGVVKRVSGSLFVDYLYRVDSKIAKILKPLKLGDYSFALYASTVFRRLARSPRGEKYALVFNVFPLPDNRTDVGFYKEFGIDVYTFLMVPVLGGRKKEEKPIRVEVAVPRGTRDISFFARKAAAYIVEWLVPGTNIPEPVLLAHYKCSIRRKDATIMLREVITRSLYSAALRAGISEANLFLDVL